MQVEAAIHGKRDVRMYQDRPVPDEVIVRILAAGRASGSSKNRQPWHFIVVRDRERIRALAAGGRYTAHVPRSAFVVVLVMDRPGYTAFDAGRAAQNMMLAAWAEGVGSCPIYFHYPEQVRALLAVPPDRHVDTAITFGYPHPEDEAALRPWKQATLAGGMRRPLAEMATWETFDGPPVAAR